MNEQLHTQISVLTEKIEEAKRTLKDGLFLRMLYALSFELLIPKVPHWN